MARIAIGAAVVAVLALAALHALRSDLDPSWRMISEYAVGSHGWVMALCFSAFAASSASLGVALFSQPLTLTARIGLACLVLAAIGLVMAARFPTDPFGTPAEAMSLSGRLHGVSFMIGVPGQMLAVLLLSLALRKREPWSRLPLSALAAGVWLSLGVMVPPMMVLMQEQRMQGVGIVGIADRAFMVIYAGWLMLAAWPIARGASSRG
jgi:hypothetical protein